MNITNIAAFDLNGIRQNFKTNNGTAFKGIENVNEDRFSRSNERGVQNLITGDRARDYQADSKVIDSYKELCRLDDMDNVVITLGKNKAFCLGDQPAARALRGRTPVDLIMSNTYRDADVILPPGPETFLRFSNEGGKISVRNFMPDNKTVGLAYKVQLNSDERLDDAEIIFAPLDGARRYFSNIDAMPKNKRICMGDANKLFLSPKIIILPSEDGCSSFLVHEQKRIKNLKEGEKIVIGRKTRDDAITLRRDKLFTDLHNSGLISREHLLVENLGGKIYITDKGKHKTYIADTTFA